MLMQIPKHRLAFGILAISLGLLVYGVFALQRFQQPEQEARHTLDQLLGKADSGLQSPQSVKPEEETNPFQQLGKMGSSLSSAFQIPSVDFTETERAYELRVPVNRPEDAQNIQLQVEPFHIQVAGQFTMQPSGQSGFSASSSFMKSFPTAQELLPNQVSRRLQGKTLVITIPKKVAGSVPSATSPKSNPHPKVLPRDLQEQLRHPQRYI